MAGSRTASDDSGKIRMTETGRMVVGVFGGAALSVQQAVGWFVCGGRMKMTRGGGMMIE